LDAPTQWKSAENSECADIAVQANKIDIFLLHKTDAIGNTSLY
jgi:hypothetical protein